MARNITSKFGVADGLDFSSSQIIEIEIEKLKPWHCHRFATYTGERLNDMVQSVKKNGIITPIIVRKSDSDAYEIIAGHNRVNAAKEAGLKSVPAIVKENLTDEEAEIYVIETNLIQRGFSDLKISEQAYAVAMRYRQLFDEDKLGEIENELYILEHGKSPENTEDSRDKPSSKMEAAAQEYGISKNTVARLLRINSLDNRLKQAVDAGIIKIRPAVELSYIDTDYQFQIADIISQNEIKSVDMKAAKELREACDSYAEPSKDVFEEILLDSAEVKKSEPSIKIVIPKEKYAGYFKGMKAEEINDTVDKALKMYFEGRAVLDV